MDLASSFDAMIVSQMKQNIARLFEIKKRHAAQEACADKWTQAELQQLFELISSHGWNTRYHPIGLSGKSLEQIRKKMKDLKEVIIGIHQIVDELISDKAQNRQLCLQLFGQMGMSNSQAQYMLTV